MGPKTSKKRRYASTATKSCSKEDDKLHRDQEIATLTERVQANAPNRGYTPPLEQRVSFCALPLSQRTQQGLLQAGPFTVMTQIQNACIPHALAGRDVLCAARTGSGKTLAFLVPLLEALYRNKTDGPGAIVLSPTRELAIQITKVLQKVGQKHSFKIGVLIGGTKDFYAEQAAIHTTHILICTPGRLLQHLEQTPYLDMSELVMLVLDEADRILDLGFDQQLKHILEFLPPERQTLLFSATQTRDVHRLATLSLQQPEYLGVHDKEASTPESLEQTYVVVPLEHKLNAVFSFVKTHLNKKSIVFLSTCAQTRHAHALMCSLRPGVPVLALHGKLAQERRTAVYFDFLQRPHAVLLATDICSRGLDFPDVDWVVHMDAPEDSGAYIHRSGRTARYRAGGQSLLFVTPQEEDNGIIEWLQQKLVSKSSGSTKSSSPIKKLSINPTKATTVSDRAAALCAQNPTLHALARKAFCSYVRSIHYMPATTTTKTLTPPNSSGSNDNKSGSNSNNKTGSNATKVIFDVHSLDVDGLAKSLGLSTTPNLQFLKQAARNRQELCESKNVNKKLARLKEQIRAEKLSKKMARLGGAVAKQKDDNPSENSDNDGDDDELLVSKKNTHEQEKPIDNASETLDAETNTTRHPKKIKVDGYSQVQNRIVFDDDGNEVDPVDFIQKSGQAELDRLQDGDELATATDTHLRKVQARLASTKALDEADQKERVRQKHKKNRLEAKGEREENTSSDHAALLGSDGADNAMQKDGPLSGTSSEESSTDDGDSDSTSSSGSDSEDGPNVQEQEDAALALIRGN